MKNLLLLFFCMIPQTILCNIQQQTNSISQLTGKQRKSFLGKQLTVTTLKLDTSRTLRTFFIQGGLHGNETLTTEFIQWLIERIALNKSLLNHLPTGTEIDLLPKANPDSYNKSRYNINNVNLNRNFSTLWGLSTEPHGTSAFSEPETQAIRDLFQTRKYLAAIDIHGYLDWVILPTNLTGLNRKPDSYDRWIKGVTSLTKKSLPDYKVKTAGDLGDGGAFEDWAYWEEDAFAVCLELKKPTRYFRHKQESNFDSFLAYEKFIYEVLSHAIKIKESQTVNIANTNSTVTN